MTLTSARRTRQRAQPGRPLASPATGAALTVVTSLVLAVWTLHDLLLSPWESRHMVPDVRSQLLILVRAVVWMIPILLYLRRHDARPPLVALGVTPRIDPHGLLLGAIPALLYLGVGAGLQTALTQSRSSRPGLGETLLRRETLYMLVVVVLEELLMRGFLLRQLLRFVRVGRAQFLSALIFMAMHLPHWVALGDFGVALLPMSLSVLLLGLVLGISAHASGSVVPAIVLHFANNILADWLAG